jgi:hypothetical protein
MEKNKAENEGRTCIVGLKLETVAPGKIFLSYGHTEEATHTGIWRRVFQE